jgi:hypothetical protein
LTFLVSTRRQSALVSVSVDLRLVGVFRVADMFDCSSVRR